ncbi:hypothetical protein EYF80_037000 [Liparis tanakae]|uniref:Uncharacterized protein n=1 Tax=Liparis tanakae TaxID=230148 RepID=A0A4Z2GGV3_9TELE|nr:hypothetical protein EYF80_037000 [Liparis tanakae]
MNNNNYYSSSLCHTDPLMSQTSNHQSGWKAGQLVFNEHQLTLSPLRQGGGAQLSSQRYIRKPTHNQQYRPGSATAMKQLIRGDCKQRRARINGGSSIRVVLGHVGKPKSSAYAKHHRHDYQSANFLCNTSWNGDDHDALSRCSRLSHRGRGRQRQRLNSNSHTEAMKSAQLESVDQDRADTVHHHPRTVWSCDLCENRCVPSALASSSSFPSHQRDLGAANMRDVFAPVHLEASCLLACPRGKATCGQGGRVAVLVVAGRWFELGRALRYFRTAERQTREHK